MNRRNFLLATGGLITIPVTASSEEVYVMEKVIMETLRRMKVGDTIKVSKVGETTWALSGDIGERFE